MLRDRGVFFGRDEAEALAVSALSFLVEKPEALGRFLALTGIGPATLRQSAADPAFLTGVLDFLLGDEALLTAFATDAGIRAERIGAARRLLEGKG
jgi:hypothetical protein